MRVWDDIMAKITEWTNAQICTPPPPNLEVFIQSVGLQETDDSLSVCDYGIMHLNNDITRHMYLVQDFFPPN